MTIGRSAGVTDTGRKRRRNEDAYVVRPPLFAVADGMGGAQAGEVASRLAVEALGETAEAASGEDRVAALIQAANRRVYQRSSEDASASGMGTTMTVALVEDGTVAIGHVGDSRAYLLRGGAVEQLTDDHSLVAELLRNGKLSPEEAETHPQRSVITRALGTDPDVDVDTFTIEGRPGDVFLLCSDGLTSMVGDDVILETVERHRPDFDAAARELVRRANRLGGEDNITVVFFELATEGSADETAVLPTARDTSAADDASLDDDTLDELDFVPAIDTMVVPPEQAGAIVRPAADPEAERNATARLVLAVVAALALLLATAALLYWGLTRL